jgi:hypothetical protein
MEYTKGDEKKKERKSKKLITGRTNQPAVQVNRVKRKKV